MTSEERFNVAREAFKRMMTAQHRSKDFDAALEIRRRIESGVKVCVQCHVEQDIENFNEDSEKLDGHRYECGSCSRLRRRERQILV